MAHPPAKPFGTTSGDPLADRRFDFAAQLAERGDFAAAADLLAQAIDLAPHWPPLYFHLGEAHGKGGHTDEATRAYRAYLERDATDRMGAHVKLALLASGQPLPTMPQGYVASLFDEYAPRFDHALVEKLEYRTPGQIAAALQTVAGNRTFTNILDLGCGTGLALEAVKASVTGRTTGIDLSPGMIEQARQKKLYDDLVVASLEDYLPHYQGPPFDLILCADVLVYIGALETLFAQITNVMDPNALFAFSVQDSDGPDWILRNDHRYAHSASYIHTLASANNLRIAHEQKSILRKDGTNDINGIIFVNSMNDI